MNEDDAPETEQFDPEAVLAILERHGVKYVMVGGYAARLHGSERPTRDVTPATTDDNLGRLADALAELGACIRTEAVPEGLPFAASAESLRGVTTLNLQTRHGELDLTFRPDGTSGYDDPSQGATIRPVGQVQVRVASLADVIRSKEAAGRSKDWEALPELYKLAGGSTSPHLRQSATESAHQPQRTPSADERIAAARKAAARGARRVDRGDRPDGDPQA